MKLMKIYMIWLCVFNRWTIFLWSFLVRLNPKFLSIFTIIYLERKSNSNIVELINKESEIRISSCFLFTLWLLYRNGSKFKILTKEIDHQWLKQHNIPSNILSLVFCSVSMSRFSLSRRSSKCILRSNSSGIISDNVESLCS